MVEEPEEDDAEGVQAAQRAASAPQVDCQRRLLEAIGPCEFFPNLRTLFAFTHTHTHTDVELSRGTCNCCAATTAARKSIPVIMMEDHS